MNTTSAALLNQIESEIEAWSSQIEVGLSEASQRLDRAKSSLLALPPRTESSGCSKTQACAAELRAQFSGYSNAVHAHADHLAGLTTGLRDLFRDLKAREFAGLSSIQESFSRLGVALPSEPEAIAAEEPEIVTSDTPVEKYEPTASAQRPPVMPLPLKAFDGSGNRRLMGEILVEAGVVTGDELSRALLEQEDAPHRRLGAILMNRGYTTGHLIARVVASQLQMPFVDLEDYPVKHEAVQLIARRMAELHLVIPIDSSTVEIIVAMTNPLDMIATDDVERVTGLRVIPVVAAIEDVKAAICEYYGKSA